MIQRVENDQEKNQASADSSNEDIANGARTARGDMTKTTTERNDNERKSRGKKTNLSKNQKRKNNPAVITMRDTVAKANIANTVMKTEMKKKRSKKWVK